MLAAEPGLDEFRVGVLLGVDQLGDSLAPTAVEVSNHALVADSSKQEALEHVGAAPLQAAVVHGLEYLEHHVLVGRTDVVEDHVVLEPVGETRERVTLEVTREPVDDRLVAGPGVAD